MLTSFAEDVWLETREARFLGVETGTRMTVVRLRDGGLFIHSPIAIDAAMRAEIDALGEVRSVVAPSLFHHLHLAGWMAAYPKAVFGACPGLEWKRADLAFTCVLGDQPHSLWAGELEQVYFSSRRENEVDFYHVKSKTMICADALLNLSSHPLLTTRICARIVGNIAPGIGHLERFMIRDRRLARRQADRILEWDIDKIALAHGGLVQHSGGEVMRHAYAWL